MKARKTATRWRFEVGDRIVDSTVNSNNRATLAMQIVARGPFVYDEVIIDSYVLQHGGNLITLSRHTVDACFRPLRRYAPIKR